MTDEIIGKGSGSTIIKTRVGCHTLAVDTHASQDSDQENEDTLEPRIPWILPKTKLQFVMTLRILSSSMVIDMKSPCSGGNLMFHYSAIMVCA